MPPAIVELLTFLATSRADAMIVVLGTMGACVLCRRRLQRPEASVRIPPLTFALVMAVVIAGALLAEIPRRALGDATGVPFITFALARLAMLVAAAAIAAVVLIAALRLARLRAELQAHADTERQLLEAKRAADEASRAKSDFLAVMSHEIRTPLNAVIGFANLLSETSLETTQRGYLATITTESRRLTALINDILDLSKIEEGRLVLERLPFAPVETAQEVLRLLSARALAGGVDLRFEPQVNGPLLVAGDPLRFHQVLVNLIDNAIKFSPRGSVTLYLSWAPPGGQATQGLLNIRVRDTGIGIPADKVKGLFHMFMQVDTSTTRRFGGTGLGLAICQRLVRLMGGNIHVESAVGHGSTFSFSLPLAPAALRGDPLPEEPEPPVRRVQVPRILVVDDMETNRFLLQVFLRRHGFEPELASGGEDAIRLAQRNSYDAILMDLQMPDIDGFSATQRIRAAEPPGHRTPIIALTATITKGTREKCLEAGMDEYLTKPLDLRKFKALLNTLLAAPAAVPAGRS